jgi:hypothetical protein
VSGQQQDVSGQQQDVSGQHQDVSGQHQIHLVWADGQSREEKREREKAGTTIVLLAIKACH